MSGAAGRKAWETAVRWTWTGYDRERWAVELSFAYDEEVWDRAVKATVALDRAQGPLAVMRHWVSLEWEGYRVVERRGHATGRVTRVWAEPLGRWEVVDEARRVMHLRVAGSWGAVCELKRRLRAEQQNCAAEVVVRAGRTRRARQGA
jgi:hypothetical protein